MGIRDLAWVTFFDSLLGIFIFLLIHSINSHVVPALCQPQFLATGM